MPTWSAKKNLDMHLNMLLTLALKDFNKIHLKAIEW